MSLWKQLNGESLLGPLSVKLFRVVESQEQVATTIITDNQDEQSLLEEMLEESKPKQDEALAERHYLIKTPFRYPPLAYGSRFGSIWEPSLFYGSQTVECALTEVAYYRFRFLYDLENSEKLTRHTIQSYHSSFYINAHSEQAIRLEQSPFNEYQSDLRSVTSYQTTQQLGKDMREAGVELFTYQSARSNKGLNGAAYHHKVIKSKSPMSLESWQCVTQEERIVFHNIKQQKLLEFNKEQFLYEGEFPVIN